MSLRRKFALFLMLMLVFSALVAGAFFWAVRASLPVREGELPLAGLGAPATVAFDSFAVPVIDAATREDASRVLGYVTASERLFQMDLMRRRSAGRLAEIFGEQALPWDRRQRALLPERAAAAAVAELPASHGRILEAYARGVNAYLAQARILPPEFWLLGYRPEPWRPEDTLLVILGMFQSLTFSDRDERMLSTMERCLPADVKAFLTPLEDGYGGALLGDDESPPAGPLPLESLRRLIGVAGAGDVAGAAAPMAMSAASNAWAVSGGKTADGRAILANDMHLGLGVPNIWYRAELRYDDRVVTGFTLPGVPAVVVGSNGRVAWGFTNALTDTLDYVVLEVDPADPGRYRTSEGWRRFEVVDQTIGVKDAPAVEMEIRRTLWGPVAAEALSGRPGAVKWTALEPRGMDVQLLEMDRVETLEQALDLLNRAGVPAMNAVVADDRGRIAWTLAGKHPLRRGFDGSVSRSWADGGAAWEGFLPPRRLPRLVDPLRGFVVAANQRPVGASYPHVLGSHFENGYRAYRIGQRLEEENRVSEEDMFRLQQDTRSGFYDFYRDLALSLLTDAAVAGRRFRGEIRDYLWAWDGRAEVGSLGLPLLVEWRKTLIEEVFPPLLDACRQLDPDFRYHWFKVDTPLRALLEARHPDILPWKDRYANWEGLLLDSLERTAVQLNERFDSGPLERIVWGRYNRQAIAHPLSAGVSFLAPILNMPSAPIRGCGHCVNVSKASYGVTQRLVLAPGHLGDGLVHMPGGQSGHPFSPHYGDQFSCWLEGLSLALLPERVESLLRFLPSVSAASATGSARRKSSTD